MKRQLTGWGKFLQIVHLMGNLYPGTKNSYNPGTTATRKTARMGKDASQKKIQKRPTHTGKDAQRHRSQGNSCQNYPTVTGMAVIVKSKITNMAKVVEELEPSYVAGGDAKC